MRTIEKLALFTALAAALGAISGVVSVVLDDTAQTRRPEPPAAGEEFARENGGAEALTDDALAEHVVTPERTRSLTQRIDSRDVHERHELALELLRRGPSAVAQAQALRPESKPGRALQLRIVDALQKMRKLRRGGDYVRLENHLRLRLDLDAFATVVPDEQLRAERLEYWQMALDAVRGRVAQDLATDGEVALAELELARAGRDLGRIGEAEYRALAQKRLPAVEGWIDSLRERRGVSAARVRSLEEQAQNLGR